MKKSYLFRFWVDVFGASLIGFLLAGSITLVTNNSIIVGIAVFFGTMIGFGIGIGIGGKWFDKYWKDYVKETIEQWK